MHRLVMGSGLLEEGTARLTVLCLAHFRLYFDCVGGTEAVPILGSRQIVDLELRKLAG